MNKLTLEEKKAIALILQDMQNVLIYDVDKKEALKNLLAYNSCMKNVLESMNRELKNEELEKKYKQFYVNIDINHERHEEFIDKFVKLVANYYPTETEGVEYLGIDKNGKWVQAYSRIYKRDFDFINELTIDEFLDNFEIIYKNYNNGLR